MSNFKKVKCSCGKGEASTKKITFDDGDYYLCDDKKCKQNLELELEKAEFAKSFQGKSKQSYDLSLNIILGDVNKATMITQEIIKSRPMVERVTLKRTKNREKNLVKPDE